MKYLFENWDSLKEELRDKNIFLFLDYDGALTAIVETPEMAAISKEVKNLLKKLAKKRRVKLAIISGRSLRDIKRLIGLKNIIYADNHGLEIEGPKVRFELPPPAHLEGNSSAMRSACRHCEERRRRDEAILKFLKNT